MEKVFRLNKKKKVSSSRWLLRRLNDPFVKEAKKGGYVCRSALKLKQIEEKFGIFKKLRREESPKILDLGCAPGGWCQVVREIFGPSKGFVVGVDLKTMTQVKGVDFIQGDFLSEDMGNCLQELGPFQGIISDMAPSSSGHRVTDRLKMEVLIEEFWLFVKKSLSPGGFFLFKSLKGGMDKSLEQAMSKKCLGFSSFRPQATYQSSSEIYSVGWGFGLDKEEKTVEHR